MRGAGPHDLEIDYDREMAFVAVGQDGPFSQQILGWCEPFASPDQSDAEFTSGPSKT